MALYEFNENKIVKSSAVDENGYHRDGGCVFEENFFPFNENDGSNWSLGSPYYGSFIVDVNKYRTDEAPNIVIGARYAYFGNIIDDSVFEIGINNNEANILNYNNLDLFKSTGNGYLILYKKYSAGSIMINTALFNNFPENCRELKAHIVIPFRKKDANGNYIENDYGIIQIHQR